MRAPLSHRRFSVEEYHRMAESGILGDDDRVELIEGNIIEMTPIGSRHAAVVKRMNRSLRVLPEDRYLVAVQDPIQLGRYSQPQPDLAVLRARADDYAESHPGPEDILLLIEVAENSEQYDRAVKLPLYAKAGIPEVWLILLREECVKILTEPDPSGYGQESTCRAGADAASRSVPELAISVQTIFKKSQA